jgi:hypothetical protein
LIGILPPTTPVFPACGTIPIFSLLQYSSIEATSSVDCGLHTILDFPLYCPFGSSRMSHTKRLDVRTE